VLVNEILKSHVFGSAFELSIKTAMFPRVFVNGILKNVMFSGVFVNRIKKLPYFRECL